jgi:catechol 2,3-dioxygenase-like lactoylglutathione lyase family enzyme
MCNPEIVDMIRSSFPFFADFQDSERGQRAINRLNHGQPFVLGLFSNQGALSVRQNQCSLAETLTFLRNNPNNYPRSPKARNSNQNHQFEDEDAIFQQQLQEALERSRADEVRIKREEDQRENFFRDPDEDELEKVIALSKIEHDEKVREEEILKQAILESQASYHQPELEDNYAELEQALEISKNENYRHSESVMIRNMQDVEYRDAQDRALEQERIKNERSLEKEKEKNRKQEEVKEKMKLLGEEPGLVPETCIVKFVLPNGQRIERRFYVNSQVVLLYYFIEMKGFENFELLTGFPLKFIRDGTIDSNGLKAGGLCHVRLNA